MSEREQELVRLSAHIEPIVVALVGAAEMLQMMARRYYAAGATQPADMPATLMTPLVVCSPATVAVKQMFWAQTTARMITEALCNPPEFGQYVRLLTDSAQASYADETGRATVYNVLEALILITAHSPLEPPNMHTPVHLRRLLEQMGVVADLPAEGPLELHGLADWLGGPDGDSVAQASAHADAAHLADYIRRTACACAQAGYPPKSLCDALGLPDSARRQRWLVEPEPDPQPDEHDL